MNDTRADRQSNGIFVGVADTALVPPHVAALAGDGRGHEGVDVMRAQMEARCEAVLTAAEDACKGVRPWRDSNPRSPP
jgi:hypothetical protein